MKYYNYLIGYNSRLDEIQAAVLRVKLPLLDEWNDKRRKNAEFYNRNLSGTKLTISHEDDYVKHVYHMYMLQSERREELVEFLKKNGIATGIYYPVPLHLQKAYINLGYKKGSLPNAEYLSKRTFAIPMFAELTDEEKKYIVEKLKEFDE